VIVVSKIDLELDDPFPLFELVRQRFFVE